jgi:O-antigen/teichoic acid export membrane protein
MSHLKTICSSACSRIRGALFDTIELLRAKPDLQTEGGRSRERYRRALLTTLAAGLAKVAGMIATLATIPITAPYLGPERFGLFMTISAVPLLLSFTDFGIGNGLLTELAKAHGRSEKAEARTLVSSAFFMMLATATVLIAAFVGTYRWIRWDRLFNVHSSQAIAEAGPALLVFGVSIALNMPLGIVQRMQQAFQEGFSANLWLGFGNLLSFGLLILFVRLGLGLPWLVLGVAGGPVLTSVLNLSVEFGWVRRWLAPHPSQVRLAASRKVMGTGLLIFSSQISAALLLSSPVLLMARNSGQASVASYSVLQRLYSVFVVGSSLLMTPLWPAYSEAFAKGDITWIHATFWRSLKTNLAIVAMPLLPITVFASSIVATLTSQSLRADWKIAGATGVLCLLLATRHTVAMMVNGCGFLRNTAIGFPIAAAVGLSFPFWYTKPAPDYMVPLWFSVAETIVVCVLLLDAVRVLQISPVPPTPQRQEVCA